MSISLLDIRGKTLAARPNREITFKLTNKGWEVKEAITVNRNTDGFEWCFNGKNMMHERVCFPWNIFKEISYSYWPNKIYKSFLTAQEDAKKYGGEVTECFYCEENNKTWFIQFNDFEKAAKYCEDLQVNK